MKSKIKEKIKVFPKSPGVYRFKDSTGDILYIGKAKNLNSRIKSYFLKETGRGPNIDIMVSLAEDIDFIETESEIEAIFLEAELINKLKPKYNIRLRDDKSFLVIKISKRLPLSSLNNRPEYFPSIELVRYKNVDFNDKSAEYFGPYPEGFLLKKSLNYLRKIFPYRDCSKTKYSTYRKKGRACIYGDIRVCTGPCVDWVKTSRYYKNIAYLKKFLKGDKKKIYKDLKKEMQTLANRKCFEEAALIRNQIDALNYLSNISVGLRNDTFDSNSSVFRRIESYDISNIKEEYVVGSMIVFTDGKKNTDQYRKFRIKNEEKTKSDLSRLSEVLNRRFKNNWSLPDLLVIDGGELQLKVACEALKNNNLKIPVVSIAKGPKRDKNEFYYSDQSIAKYFHGNQKLQNLIISTRDEAHRFAINYYRELHKKGMFDK